MTLCIVLDCKKISLINWNLYLNYACNTIFTNTVVCVYCVLSFRHFSIQNKAYLKKLTVYFLAIWFECVHREIFWLNHSWSCQILSVDLSDTLRSVQNHGSLACGFFSSIPLYNVQYMLWKLCTKLLNCYSRKSCKKYFIYLYEICILKMICTEVLNVALIVEA